MTKERRAVDSKPTDEWIKGWREAGRYHARQAQHYFDQDNLAKIAGHASYAAMSFAVALDAKHFGDLPDIEDSDDS